MNIKDIARLSGVSVATVSRVINNQPNVRSEKRELVLSVMKAYGYTPNIFARGLNAKSTKSIGILCSEMDDINHAKILSLLEKQLREQGFSSFLCCSGGYRPYKREHFEFLMAKQVDAIMEIGSSYGGANDLEAYKEISSQVPVIILNGFVDVPTVYSVRCDERRAIFDLVEELHNRECRYIYYLEDNTTFSATEKRNGFLEAINKYNIKTTSRCIKIPIFSNQILDTRQKIEQLIKNGRKIDAILSADDLLAVGALQALNASDIDIPVVGFNNSDFAFACTPHLTTVDNQREFVCTNAVNTLMCLLEGREAAHHILVSAKLIEGDTFKI